MRRSGAGSPARCGCLVPLGAALSPVCPGAECTWVVRLVTSTCCYAFHAAWKMACPCLGPPRARLGSRAHLWRVGHRRLADVGAHVVHCTPAGGKRGQSSTATHTPPSQVRCGCAHCCAPRTSSRPPNADDTCAHRHVARPPSHWAPARPSRPAPVCTHLAPQRTARIKSCRPCSVDTSAANPCGRGRAAADSPSTSGGGCPSSEAGEPPQRAHLHVEP